MLCHFRATTSISCRFTRPIWQVHEPTPSITQIFCCNYPKIWTARFYCTVMCPKGNQSVNAECRSECPLFAQFARLLSIIISNFSFAGTMMSVLSQKASLSQKYTNHSFGTTSVHILDATQISTRHIMSVTGHKAETSLKTYTGHTNNKKTTTKTYLIS